MTPEERAVFCLNKLNGHRGTIDRWPLQHVDLKKDIAEAIREAIAEEREACACLAESWHDDYGPALMEVLVDGKEVAKLIRARK